MHIFETSHVFADLATNHRGNRDTYESLTEACERAGIIPKIQLFSPQTFNREWPLPKTFMPSCFKLDDIDWVMRFDPLALKVASVEATHYELIKVMMETGKPLIISTGGMNDDELEDLLLVVGDHNPGVCLMHCVSMYPTPLGACNMLRITALAEAMEDIYLPAFVGWSCHTPQAWMQPLVSAITQGASQFEFHLIPEKTEPSNADEWSSLTINEARAFKAMVGSVPEFLGDGLMEQGDRGDVMEWRKRWQD